MPSHARRVFIATAVSWTVSLPVSFGLVFGDCAPYCFVGICPMIYACRNAWALLPEMMVTGMGIGLIAGGIGYAYHRPRETARGPRSTRVFDFRALLLPVPLVWLGGVFCVLLVSGLNLLVVGMAMVLASGVSIAVSVVGLGLEARRSRSA